MVLVGGVELSNMAAIPSQTLEDLIAKMQSLNLIYRPSGTISSFPGRDSPPPCVLDDSYVKRCFQEARD